MRSDDALIQLGLLFVEGLLTLMIGVLLLVWLRATSARPPLRANGDAFHALFIMFLQAVVTLIFMFLAGQFLWHVWEWVSSLT